MILIDTDILIDHFHGNPDATEFIRQALLDGETLAISVATIAEILAGQRAGEEDKTEALLSLFQVFSADSQLARQAGEYLNRYARSHRLDLGDALVAATAKIAEAPLYTRNLRHYPMEDIQVRVPYERGLKRS